MIGNKASRLDLLYSDTSFVYFHAVHAALRSNHWFGQVRTRLKAPHCGFVDNIPKRNRSTSDLDFLRKLSNSRLGFVFGRDFIALDGSA